MGYGTSNDQTAWPGLRLGLREFERAYHASRATSDAEVASINKQAEDHDKLVQAGQATWSQEDDEGNVVYDYGEHLGEQVFDAEQVLNLVRLAFVISLHHFVEQRLAAKLPNNKYMQAEAFNWLKAFGWTPQEDKLNQLRLAANCAKHSEGSSADQLYQLRPDMFDEDLVKGWGAKPSYASLKLSDAHMIEFFEAVKASVPKMAPAF